jgi:hypothetical protein
MEQQSVFLGHGSLIAIEAVDDDHAHTVVDDAAAYAMRKLAWRKLRRIDLIYDEHALLAMCVQIGAHPFGTAECDAKFLVEHEYRDLLATPHSRGCILKDKQGFSGTSRPEHERTGSFVDAAPEQLIELANTTWHRDSVECASVFRRYKARKHLHAACRNDEVVIAATESAATELSDFHPAPFGAIVGCHFFQANDPVSDAVDRLVEGIGRKIVEH